MKKILAHTLIVFKTFDESLIFSSKNNLNKLGVTHRSTVILGKILLCILKKLNVPINRNV
jgi:hypothetical protein